MGFFCWDCLVIVALFTSNSNEKHYEKSPDVVIAAFNFRFFRRIFFPQESIHIQDMGKHERKHVPSSISRPLLSIKG